jgi:type I restriction enzyme S subunit
MRLELFFEKFNQLADAPDALARMRELLLQLAVQGKLVEHLESDGTADELLETIARKLGKDSSKYLSDYEPKERPLETIPHNWRWVPTSALCDLQAGKRMKGGAQESGVISVGGEHLKPDGTVDYTVPRYVSSEFYDEMRSGRVAVHDTLMVKDGATTGKTAFIATLPPDGRAAVNEHVFILRWHDPIEKRLAFYFIRAFALMNIATKSAGLIGGIRREAVLEFPFPLPPLAEQKRIVAKVDELMELCDRLGIQQRELTARYAALARASLARFADAPTPANLDFLFHTSYNIDPADLRKTIFTLAVQGKLVPQDPNNEPADETIRRIPKQPLPARFDKRSSARIQGLAALSVGPTERDVPEGWVCVPLIQIARLESGHTPSRARPDWWDGDVAWVGVVDARLHDGKTILETRQHTNEEGLANSAARVLPAGTVCVSRTASVGYVVILGKPMATSQDFVNWVPSEAVTSDWLRLVFTSEKDAFDRFSKGAVHQTIYYPEWLSMHTLLPPLAEQRRIVAKVDQLMALVDQLDAQVTTARDNAGRLMDAVVAELTEQQVTQ